MNELIKRITSDWLHGLQVYISHKGSVWRVDQIHSDRSLWVVRQNESGISMGELIVDPAGIKIYDAECPACGRVLYKDGNSYACHTCKRLWPHGIIDGGILKGSGEAKSKLVRTRIRWKERVSTGGGQFPVFKTIARSVDGFRLLDDNGDQVTDEDGHDVVLTGAVIPQTCIDYHEDTCKDPP